jgi:hypothetical protein
MSKLLKCKIDVKKINKDLLFVGSKCTYLDIDVWILDKPDQFGNDVSIQQQTGKDEPKIYIGSGKVKEFEKKPESKPENKEGEWRGKKEVKSMSNPDELSGVDELGDLPF